jgi:hypothetical protein
MKKTVKKTSVKKNTHRPVTASSPDGETSTTPVAAARSSSLWRTVLAWVDAHFLTLLAGFLLAFIPLWPKIPVWSPIEQYIVRVRLEDFAVLFTAGVWGIQFLRQKVSWRSPFFWGILAYGVLGLVSTLVAIFVIHTIPLEFLHVGKSVLHFFRYLQYFSLFVIAFGAVRTRKDVVILMAIFTATIVAVSMYGYGQRNWYWPVYSTMNREFSKGVRLYLTEHARVQSTFAGHYDMAAFLVLGLPLLFALSMRAAKKSVIVALQLSFWAGCWLLIVSASRTSFVAFLGSMYLLIALGAWLARPTWRERASHVVKVGAYFTIVIGFLFVAFGEDMNERLAQVLQAYPETHKKFHTLNHERKLAFANFIEGTVGTKFWLAFRKSEPPTNGIAVDNVISPDSNALTPTDARPVSTIPSDVYVQVPEPIQVASTSASGAATTVTVNRDRIYSDCAQRYGLSLCIRLETLWPKALAGFMMNPLTGKGYATLNKDSIEQFTEAESTDNNFLRTLGETGAVGFLIFYGLVAMVLWYSVRSWQTNDPLLQAMGLGLFTGTLGLLFNAFYIDVFAASKVAFTYWGLSGIFIGYFFLTQRQSPRHA